MKAEVLTEIKEALAVLPEYQDWQIVISPDLQEKMPSRIISTVRQTRILGIFPKTEELEVLTIREVEPNVYRLSVKPGNSRAGEKTKEILQKQGAMVNVPISQGRKRS